MLNKIIVGFLFFFSTAHADFTPPIFDINFSPFAGAGNFLALEKGLEKIEGMFFPTPSISLEEIKNSNQDLSFLQDDLFARRIRNLLFWLPANLSMAVTQHEVFGHGYRIRDLGSKYATVKNYRMYVITGKTQFEPTSNLTASQMLTIDIAGLEADSILANRIRFKWAGNGQLDPRLAGLYAISATTLLGYSLSVHKTAKTMVINGNDISCYLFFLNALYPDGHVSYRSLRNFSFINLLDPFFLYSIYSGLNYEKYGITTSIPMFSLGSVKYLPVVRAVLTPFGLQGVLENYFVNQSNPTYAYLKWGQNGPNIYCGVGIENQQVFTWPYATLGFRLDVWRQPNILFKNGAMSAIEIMELPEDIPVPQLYPTVQLNKKQVGALMSVIGTVGNEAWPTRFFYEFGLKTRGYLAGESLRQTPVIRIGMAGNF